MYKIPNVLLFDCIFFRESFINDPSRTGLCRHATGIRNFVSLGHISTWSYHTSSSIVVGSGRFFKSSAFTQVSQRVTKVGIFFLPSLLLNKKEKISKVVTMSAFRLLCFLNLFYHLSPLHHIGRVIKSLYKSFISPFFLGYWVCSLGWASARLYSIWGLSVLTSLLQLPI